LQREEFVCEASNYPFGKELFKMARSGVYEVRNYFNELPLKNLDSWMKLYAKA